MSTRSLHPLIALASAAVLGLSLVGSVVAQEEATPSPSPEVEAALDTQADRHAEQDERKAERKAERDERKSTRERRRAEQDAAKAVRAADRSGRKADRAAAKSDRRVVREAKRAAWAQVKDACTAELQAARADEALDRAGRREALREARGACKESYLAAVAAAVAGGAAVDELYTEAASDGTGVVRTDLGIAEPDSAPGEELGLWHYLIPAQTELAAHTHPGWQLARITDGELEYTVLEGEGVLLRADGGRAPMGPGTYLLASGDGVIENPTLVHLGANRTDAPVTIISATLFEDGEPISTLVEEPVAAE